MTKRGKLFRLTRSCCGVGLIEILVGVAILGILLAAAIPSMSDFMERRRVVAVAGELNNLIAFTKSEVNVISNAGLGIHLEDDPGNLVSCAAVVTTTAIPTCKCYYAADDICPSAGFGKSKLVRLFQLPKSGGVTFRATATHWGSLDHVLAFKRGNPFQAAQNFKLTVTGARTGAQLVIALNQAGRVTTCSSTGRLGGYPTCS